MNCATAPSAAIDLSRACSQCRFAKVSWIDWLFVGGYRFAKCSHPSALSAWAPSEIASDALTTGKAREPSLDEMGYCATNRRFDCGRGGKFFDPKPTARFRDREIARAGG